MRTRPDVVLDIHRKYFEAGSDIVETNSLAGRRWCWRSMGWQREAHELNKQGGGAGAAGGG